MNDVQNIVYTTCGTLIAGIILLVVTELLKVLVITPIQKTREQMQVTLSRVDFYSNRLTNFFSATPTGHELETILSITKGLREAATDLNSNYTLVPMKRLLSSINILPSQERIDVAFKGLMYLHNSILYEGKRDYILNLIEINSNHIDRIRAALTGEPIPDYVKPKQVRR